MGTLAELSDNLAEAVAAAAPCVVRVEARDRLPASGIVWAAEGVVVTAQHAVEREENIAVGLPDGGASQATLVGRDPGTDLAVLRAQASGLRAADWAAGDDVRVGHLALALGRPGKTVQATLGIVSAFGGGWRTPTGGRVDRYLQTDVVMYPGFSGGPLVSARGQIMGLNTSALLRDTPVALPLATVRRVVEALLAHGRVRRGYLGIGAQTVRLPASLAAQLGQETGLLLVALEPGSPAEQHGLLLGDVLVALDGQAVRHQDDLASLLGDERIGTRLTARIVRAGKVTDLAVVVGERL